MENLDNGRTYIITGNWDPEREDTLVLNTETKKGNFFLVVFSIIDLVHNDVILWSRRLKSFENGYS